MCTCKCERDTDTDSVYSHDIPLCASQKGAINSLTFPTKCQLWMCICALTHSWASQRVSFAHMGRKSAVAEEVSLGGCLWRAAKHRDRSEQTVLLRSLTLLCQPISSWHSALPGGLSHPGAGSVKFSWQPQQTHAERGGEKKGGGGVGGLLICVCVEGMFYFRYESSQWFWFRHLDFN